MILFSKGIVFPSKLTVVINYRSSIRLVFLWYSTRCHMYVYSNRYLFVCGSLSPLTGILLSRSYKPTKNRKPEGSKA